MKLRSRWTMGGAAYVVLALALGTAAAVDGHGYGFYVAAIATFPSCLILSPFFYPVMVMAAMAASMSGSGPSWVIVTLNASWFGAAAVLNVLLVRLVAGNPRPCWMRLRRLVTRA